MKIYTKTGDKGDTSLIGGFRISKNHNRIESYGTADELNASLGIALAHLQQNQSQKCDDLAQLIEKLQHQIFNIGSHLACASTSASESLPALNNQMITDLENAIDQFEAPLDPLKNFILPGGSLLSAHLHMSRTICRRLERRVVTLLNEEPGSGQQILVYINRLSDLLFVLARYANHTLENKDKLWNPSCLE